MRLHNRKTKRDLTNTIILLLSVIKKHSKSFLNYMNNRTRLGAFWRVRFGWFLNVLVNN